MSSRVVHSTVIALAFALTPAIAVSAGTGTFVLPPGSADTEGLNNEGTALGLFSNTVQVVYGAEVLDDAGVVAGDRLTGLAFRVDTTESAPLWTADDYQVRLATSLNRPGDLDRNLANNRGADYAVVRAGKLSYDGSEYPTGGNPNDFGEVIAFAVPFVYAGGDLLLEYTHTFVSGDSTADAVVQEPFVQTQFAPGFDGTMEGFGGFGNEYAPVVQFTVERACPGDVDGDGAVGFQDLLAILANWGPCEGCPADANGDGDVGFPDILVVLGEWGPCP